MQKELPAIKKAGATLIAITPELPDNSMNTIEKHGLEFEVLTDQQNKVAKEYGLVFKLTPEVAKLYGKFCDMKKMYGDAKTNELPLTATYIIGQDGKILWSFLHHDHHKRAEPKDIVEFLEKMKKK